jgi:Holliday junction resolvasome RuvABC endonuclease subunit
MTPDVRVMGVDLSVSSTGICLPDGSVDRIITTVNPDGGEHAQTRRLALVCEVIVIHVTETDAHVVALEGFSYNSKQSQQHLTGGLGWMVRHALDQVHVRWVVIPPASLKKYATGRGNAGKDEVLTSAAIRTGRPDLCHNDVVDAFWLRAMCLDGLGHPLLDMPKLNRTALAAVDWPSLEPVP